ncbi:MAG TPA: hypothetical protein VIX80_00110 [Candidatus Kapabacteria bacterium]
MIRSLIIVLASFLLAAPLAAQEPARDSLWSSEVSLYYYFLPHQDDFPTLIGYADHGALHLEARYNYEDLKTASVFGGYNFEFSVTLTDDPTQFSIIPMIGFAFGRTDAIIPGLELRMIDDIFDVYFEYEYTITLPNEETNFFYSWTEIAMTPIENFRAGGAITSTRLLHSEHDGSVGIFGEYTFGKFKTGLFYFLPLRTDGFVLAKVAMEF